MWLFRRQKTNYELFLELCECQDSPELRTAYDATKRSFEEMSRIYYWEMPITLRQWLKQQLRSKYYERHH